LFCFKQTK